MASLSKVEMIDQAIKDLGGDISKVTFYGCEGHTYLKATNSYAGGYALCHYNSSSVTDGLCFCTIEEFEQRKKELKQMSKGWYDYEKQKALALPPIGEKVNTVQTDDMVYGQDETNCEVVAHVEDVAVIRMSYGLGCFVKEALQPLDWDKLSTKIKLISEVSTLLYQSGCRHFDVEKAVDKLYELGYLKLPENNLK